jgi:hypothetical protein
MGVIPQLLTIALDRHHTKITQEKEGTRPYFIVYSNKRYFPDIIKVLGDIKQAIKQ